MTVTLGNNASVNTPHSMAATCRRRLRWVESPHKATTEGATATGANNTAHAMKFVNTANTNSQYAKRTTASTAVHAGHAGLVPTGAGAVPAAGEGAAADGAAPRGGRTATARLGFANSLASSNRMATSATHTSDAQKKRQEMQAALPGQASMGSAGFGWLK